MTDVLERRTKLVKVLKTADEKKTRLIGEMCYEGRYCAVGMAGHLMGLTDEEMDEGRDNMFESIRKEYEMSDDLQDWLVINNDLFVEGEPKKSWKYIGRVLEVAWGIK